MEEKKPEGSQPHDPVEESQDGDGGLVSKLARAHSTLPPEQRWAPSLRDSAQEISNPELEDQFRMLLKQQEVLATYQAQKRQKPDPATLAALETRIRQLQARGDALSDDSSATASPAEELISGAPRSTPCEKCGQVNSPSCHFCGTCGAELTRSSDTIRKASSAVANAVPADPIPVALADAATRQSRVDGFRVAILISLFAVLALLALRQWPSWRQRLVGKPTQPVVGGEPAIQTSKTASEEPAIQISKATAPIDKEPATSPTTVHAAPAPATIRVGKVAGKPEPRRGPPVVVKQSLPTAAPIATSAEVALAAPTPGPPATVQIVKPAESPPVSNEPSTPARIPQLSPGALIYKVDPQYPQTARNARVQGSVVMHAVIGMDGTIQQLELIKGNPLLVNAAMDAAKKWRYRPTLLDGKPVEVETTITISFKGE